MIRQEMSGEGETGLGEKKIRLAFLDMLIYMSDNLTKLSIEDIREEVDTFMFEVNFSKKKKRILTLTLSF